MLPSRHAEVNRRRFGYSLRHSSLVAITVALTGIAAIPQIPPEVRHAVIASDLKGACIAEESADACVVAGFYRRRFF